jgi:hypothetical protein
MHVATREWAVQNGDDAKEILRLGHSKDSLHAGAFLRQGLE